MRGAVETIEKSKLPRGSTIALAPNPIDDGNSDANDGIEGVAYDRAKDVFYICKERGPKRGIYRVDWTGKTEKVEIPRLFAGVSDRSDPITDVGDLHFADGSLLVLSQESGVVVQVVLSGSKGEVTGQFPPLGMKLPHKQAEGVTLSPDRRELWIIGEPREIARYTIDRPAEAQPPKP
jgi:uncharacterized protein YjiK